MYVRNYVCITFKYTQYFFILINLVYVLIFTLIDIMYGYVQYVHVMKFQITM